MIAIPNHALRTGLRLSLRLGLLAAATLLSCIPVLAADRPAFYANLERYNDYDRVADVVLTCESAENIQIWHPAISGETYSIDEVCRYLSKTKLKKKVMLVVFPRSAELPRRPDANQKITDMWRRLRKAGFARVVLYSAGRGVHWE
jgi:hypothetical protein